MPVYQAIHQYGDAHELSRPLSRVAGLAALIAPSQMFQACTMECVGYGGFVFFIVTPPSISLEDYLIHPLPPRVRVGSCGCPGHTDLRTSRAYTHAHDVLRSAETVWKARMTRVFCWCRWFKSENDGCVNDGCVNAVVCLTVASLLPDAWRMVF